MEKVCQLCPSHSVTFHLSWQLPREPSKDAGDALKSPVAPLKTSPMNLVLKCEVDLKEFGQY